MIIKSQRIKRALLTALADEEMLKIMNCVIDRSKSFNDIIAENSSISRTTVFRKIKWLLKEGLIIVDKIVLTQDGKKFSLYNSTLKAINAKYEVDNVTVEAEPNFDIAKKWIEKFFSLD
jgi:predicted transcriptional regulator